VATKRLDMPPYPHRPSKPTRGLSHGEIARFEGDRRFESPSPRQGVSLSGEFAHGALLPGCRRLALRKIRSRPKTAGIAHIAARLTLVPAGGEILRHPRRMDPRSGSSRLMLLLKLRLKSADAQIWAGVRILFPPPASPQIEDAPRILSNVAPGSMSGQLFRRLSGSASRVLWLTTDLR